MTRQWSSSEVAALPVVLDLVTAGSVLGMGRTAAYEAHRRGEFPVPVLQVGHRYRVVSQHLKQLLLSTPEAPGSADAITNVHDLRRTG